MGEWRSDPRDFYRDQNEGFTNTNSVDMYTGQPRRGKGKQATDA